MFNVLFAIGVLAVLLKQVSAVTSQYNATVTHYFAAAAKSNQCELRYQESGLTGSSFLDFQAHGSWMELAIDAPESVMELVVSYSAGKSDYPVEVMIDGKVIETLKMKETKDWKTWSRESLVIPTVFGRHTIRFTASLSRGPFIDWIALRHLQRETSPMPSEPSFTSNVVPSHLLPSKGVVATARALASAMMKGRSPGPTQRANAQPS